MKDYRLHIKIKNNYLLSAMERKGFKNGAQLAKYVGLSPYVVGRYINLKLSPYLKNGEISKSVFRIAEALDEHPENLFPPQHLDQPLKSNSIEHKTDMADISDMMIGDNSPLEKLIQIEDNRDFLKYASEKLPEKDFLVIKHRFGISEDVKTLEEIGEILGVTRQRASQMEEKAMKKLRFHKKEIAEKFIY